ncbi:MAG: HDIG domain-containing protein [Spirochaetales bacterium]|nr:HDIG domain-containing protein [Spirochaetales bacterium]
MNRKKNKKEDPDHSVLSKLKAGTVSLVGESRIRRTVILTFLITYLLILLGDNFLFLKQLQSRDNLQLGDVAEEDLFSEQSYRYVDADSTERLTALRLASVNGVFVRQEGITQKILEDLDYYRLQFEDLAAREAPLASYQALGFPFGEDQIAFLLENQQYSVIFGFTRDITSQILNQGYFNLLNYEEDGSYATGVVEVIGTGDEGGIATLPSANLLTSDSLEGYLDKMLRERGLENGELTITAAMVNFFLKENCYFNEKLTAQKREQVIGSIEPVYVTVEAGEKIIGLGEVVTSAVQQELEAYWNQIGRLKAVPLLKPFIYLLGLLVLALLLIVYLPVEIENIKNFLLVLWSIPVFVIPVVLFEKIILWQSVSFTAVFIPTGLFTLLISQVVTEKKGVIVYGMILSLLSFLIHGLEAPALLYSFITALAGTLVLTGGEKRIDILKSGLWLGAVNLLCIIYFDAVEKAPFAGFAVDSLAAFLFGVLYSLLVLSLLPLFEHFMNACTAYRLAELANLNEPILKRLFIQAPGTYVHSINVAYMAEPACEAIGCNSLLARVAAYYHDIGKMDQPDYFIENQKESNKHDELKANLSAAIIKAHVKLGVEKGREMNLPEEVIQIIQQHHGTSVIRYFYDKAEKEIAESGKSSLNKEDYCHYGPRPQNKEAAVVMLADTIEAASRTLKKPSKAKLEKFVWDLIMHRLQTGELNDSGLTLNELEKIKDSFVHVLIGHFHTRIEYPDQKKENQS